MPWLVWLIVEIVVFSAGFVGGIAFWKHRVYLENEAKAEANKLQSAAQKYIPR